MENELLKKTGRPAGFAALDLPRLEGPRRGVDHRRTPRRTDRPSGGGVRRVSRHLWRRRIAWVLNRGRRVPLRVGTVANIIRTRQGWLYLATDALGIARLHGHLTPARYSTPIAAASRPPTISRSTAARAGSPAVTAEFRPRNSTTHMDATVQRGSGCRG